MTGAGLGSWWDPDDGAGTGSGLGPDTAQGATQPRATGPGTVGRRTPPEPLQPAGAPPGAAGLTGETAYEKAPTRWWLVGVVANGVLLVVAAALAVARLDLGWAALAVAAAVSAALLVVAEGRQPRRVSASEAGVEVAARRSSVHLRWEELRRVRTRQEVGFDHVDLHLERDTGDLVRLPRKTPGGVVEAWRHRLCGGRPVEELPQVWRLSYEESQAQNSAQLLVFYLPLMLLNVAVHFVDLPFAWFVALFLVLLCGLALTMARVSRRPLLSVDRRALTRHGWRTRAIPWSQVRDVRRLGRYDPQVVVELDTGEEVPVLGPGEDVVRGWWHLAVPDRPTER